MNPASFTYRVEAGELQYTSPFLVDALNEMLVRANYPAAEDEENENADPPPRGWPDLLMYSPLLRRLVKDCANNVVGNVGDGRQGQKGKYDPYREKLRNAFKVKTVMLFMALMLLRNSRDAVLVLKVIAWML